MAKRVVLKCRDHVCMYTHTFMTKPNLQNLILNTEDTAMRLGVSACPCYKLAHLGFGYAKYLLHSYHVQNRT